MYMASANDDAIFDESDVEWYIGSFTKDIFNDEKRALRRTGDTHEIPYKRPVASRFARLCENCRSGVGTQIGVTSKQALNSIKLPLLDRKRFSGMASGEQLGYLDQPLSSVQLRFIDLA
jgi:hypothetical protein